MYFCLYIQICKVKDFKEALWCIGLNLKKSMPSNSQSLGESYVHLFSFN